MNFIEFIGFIVSLLAMIYLFVKQIIDQRRRHANPEAYERKMEEREELIRRLMHGEDVHPAMHRSAPKKNGLSLQQPSAKISKDVPKKKMQPVKSSPPPPMRKAMKGMDPYAFKQTGPTPIDKAMEHLGSRKELVILSEIYGPPKGFQ